MEEILALQRQLAAAQESAFVAKLSDRNVVDIVDVLIKTYETKLIFTIDGREYITPEHLENQIREIIVEYGRINVVELPKLLNVGIERVDPRIDSVCKRFGDILFLNGELLTNDYLDTIAEEINEELQMKQKIPLSELTLKYNMTFDYLLQIIQNRLGVLIQGNIQNNTLVTISYQNTVKSQINGILRGCVRPTSIMQMKKISGIEENIITDMINELIASNEICGHLKQSTFVSNLFIQSQKAIVEKFLNQNAYVEFDYLQKNLYIQKPQEFLKDMLGENCIFLENCCFKKEGLINIKEHILEIINSEGFVDVSNLLPSFLSESETENLIQEHMEMANVEIRGTLVVSKAFLDKCVGKFRDKIIVFIYKAPSKDEETKDDSKSKSKSKKKKGDSEEDAIFPKDDIIQHLKTNKLIPTEYDPEFENLIFTLLREPLQSSYNQIKTELFESKTSVTTDLVTKLQTLVDEQMTSLAFVSKSLQELSESDPKADLGYIKQKFYNFVKQTIEDIILLFIRKYSINLPLNLLRKAEDDSDDLTKQQRVPVNRKSRFVSNEAFKNSLDFLPKEQNKLLENILNLVEHQKLFEAFDLLKKHANDFNLRPVVIDKKSEKNFIYAQRYFFKEDLQNKSSDSMKALFYTLNLMLLEKGIFFGVLNFDEKVLNTMIKIVIDSGSSEVSQLLTPILENIKDPSKYESFEQNVSQLKSLLGK